MSHRTDARKLVQKAAASFGTDLKALAPEDRKRVMAEAEACIDGTGTANIAGVYASARYLARTQRQ